MSRNAREGWFAGRCAGKPVRWHGLIRRVRSAKARAIMARRVYRVNGLNVPGWAVE